MTENQERLEILEMIQNGNISPQEGLKLLEALGESWEIADQEYHLAKAVMEESAEDDEFLPPAAEIDAEEMNKWKAWWIVPFWSGVALTVLGGILMFRTLSGRGIGWGFIASWIPFLIGVGFLMLGWNSRTGPWIHIRIQQQPGEKPERISFSFPIPTRFLIWGIKTFGNYIPSLDTTGWDEILLGLGNYSQGDTPLSVDVDDGENGEKVKIYIG